MRIFISNIDDRIAENLKYDDTYSRQHIKFYDAGAIPHFNEQTPDGVFNAEYDCALDNAQEMNVQDVVNWIKNE